MFITSSLLITVVQVFCVHITFRAWADRSLSFVFLALICGVVLGKETVSVFRGYHTVGRGIEAALATNLLVQCMTFAVGPLLFFSLLTSVYPGAPRFKVARFVLLATHAMTCISLLVAIGEESARGSWHDTFAFLRITVCECFGHLHVLVVIFAAMLYEKYPEETRRHGSERQSTKSQNLAIPAGKTDNYELVPTSCQTPLV